MANRFGGWYSDEGALLLKRNIAHYCNLQKAFMWLLRARSMTVINLKAASGQSLNPSEPSRQEASDVQKSLLKTMECSRLAINLEIRITCQCTWCHMGQTSSGLDTHTCPDLPTWSPANLGNSKSTGKKPRRSVPKTGRLVLEIGPENCEMYIFPIFERLVIFHWTSRARSPDHIYCACWKRKCTLGMQDAAHV